MNRDPIRIWRTRKRYVRLGNLHTVEVHLNRSNGPGDHLQFDSDIIRRERIGYGRNGFTARDDDCTRVIENIDFAVGSLSKGNNRACYGSDSEELDDLVCRCLAGDAYRIIEMHAPGLLRIINLGELDIPKSTAEHEECEAVSVPACDHRSLGIS